MTNSGTHGKKNLLNLDNPYYFNVFELFVIWHIVATLNFIYGCYIYDCGLLIYIDNLLIFGLVFC